MKEVCILSMQRVNNFGSLLQAYSLKKLINERGYHVSFLDIEFDVDEGKLINSVDAYAVEIENAAKKNVPGKIDKYFIHRVLHNFRLKKQTNLFEQFRNDILKIKDQSKKEYDLCVIGSDEVFNCTQGKDIPFTSQLFGNVKCAKAVVSYAASCGYTNYDDIPDEVRGIIQHALKNLRYISVRDTNTENFINKMIHIKPEVNFDPVLVGDFETEMALYPCKSQKYKDVCIIYAYRNHIYDQNDIDSILMFCKNHSLRPIAVGGHQKWIKEYWIGTPFEMLSLFKQARFIITNTFHGTIFSAKYNGNFAVFVREANKNKLEDLIQRLEIEKHKINSLKRLEDTWTASNSRLRVSEICLKERKKTISYLKKIMGDL